uniref:Uncharacterized protein n=1 Tax=Entomoneis paludosa TaxID=265537 RepID=A0A7S2VE65_9STRA|mmetsp:Transcript_15106/g.31132  ORF Transcript_15106/g.31132 Transcript_15106/m.31132 type:complete len:113 (+) Transcript_15106:96-434(+)
MILTALLGRRFNIDILLRCLQEVGVHGYITAVFYIRIFSLVGRKERQHKDGPTTKGESLPGNQSFQAAAALFPEVFATYIGDIVLSGSMGRYRFPAPTEMIDFQFFGVMFVL